MIPAKTYQARRARLAKNAKLPLVVVTGADLVQSSSDETYEFQQDGYFYYLTGIDEPGWILVVNVEKGEEFLIYTNESSYHSDVWEVVKSPQEISVISGINSIFSRRDGWAKLKQEVISKKSIGTIVPNTRFLKSYGMFIHPSKNLLVDRLRRIDRSVNLIDISSIIRSLRTIKDAQEIELIKRSTAITAEAFKSVREHVSGYKSESEIFADLTKSFLTADADFGYRPCIASDSNATKLHYKANNAPIIKNSYILIDAGARIDHYNADVTRVIAISKPSKRWQEYVDEVRAAQTEVLNYLKPGITMRELESYTETVIAKSLKNLKLIDLPLKKNIRKYYPHAVSHHLGIDLHDSCDYELPLAPDSVITIEPGIYCPEEGIGVRIEDDILLTEDGFINLTEMIEK